MSFSESRLDRRAALKWMIAAGATLAAAGGPMRASGQAAPPATKGYGTDPLLNKEYAPGDVWPLTMTDAQRRTAAALCALIIPAEGGVPSAADLKVHDFIDEWISAPYPDQLRDRETVLEGLVWLNRESRARFGEDFAALTEVQQSAIADDICDAVTAKPDHREGARFFAKFRDLTAAGFFTTPEGMKDVGYVGNTPLIEFKGPPPEVLAKLGLA
ncbi:gluconate 2-dehydrogenase subunit 3 family protein [Oleiharenicola lentus]|uniref:Gluconate 2-dehydrogenase subunit 3 family protein n=1 Tax=Oleiharenicola lentus TaxID=2508720 RepID=A0A4Q1CCV3_9BACT|nr:gluconate 2-dehydrogenase subunit 3 family protein [Oleiharenicola lentus]RXK56781.1 gluconate 2-dehydrogenase subunit 3 family protein [Oleiharenicola lentus]